MSYEKFRFDPMTLTPPKCGFPPPPSKAVPLRGVEKKNFFCQNYWDSIKISYGKFRFDATSITPPKCGFHPPPSKAAPPGGPRKKNFFSPNEAEC